MNGNGTLCGRLLALTLAAGVVAGGCPRTSAGAGPQISAPVLSARQVGRYEKLELTFSLARRYNNPFDSREVAVDGVFAGPDGQGKSVPGFLYQEFACARQGKYDFFTAKGDPVWKIRFAPTAAGAYRCRVRARDADGESESGEPAFECVASDNPGFVRAHGRAFRLDSGAPFIPVGCAINGEWGNGPAPYLATIEKMPATGRNAGRVMLAPHGLALEWIPGLNGYGVWPHYGGVHRCNLASAWSLDAVLDEARRRGVYLDLCLLVQGMFYGTGWDWQWPANPYNRAKGGFLADGCDFFTDARARACYQDQLRYVLARWGYSTQVLAWELFNEIDWGIYDNKWDPAPIVRWHAEMARYLKQNDVNGHLVCTSTASPASLHRAPDWFWELHRIPEFDLGNHHIYHGRSPGKMDPEVELEKGTRDVLSAIHQKPWLITEWGLDIDRKWDAEDQPGVGVHNGLWAGALCFPGSTVWAWYTELVDQHQLWGHFSAAAAYLRGEDFSAARTGAVSGDNRLECLALECGGKILVWARNRASLVGAPRPAPIAGCVVTVPGVRGASYRVEYWDTFAGKLVGARTVRAQAGSLAVPLPEVLRDIALKITAEAR